MSKQPAVPTGTRQKLLRAAVQLMRRTGLSGAGINEIVRESGAPKGSVYHFFPAGKQQIAAEALAQYAESVAAFIDTALRGKRSAASKVRALFEAFGSRVEQGNYESSCAAGAVCLDLDEESGSLREVVAGALDLYVDAIARHFDSHDKRRSRSFAGLLLSAIEGAYIRSRAHRSSEPFHEAGKWLAGLASQQFPGEPP
jgi:TetR/AcrR family transcriptional regulator, lmrAB and yxaGH operons repressor